MLWFSSQNLLLWSIFLSSGLIYTYIGDILIAVNPFQKMHIYDDSVSQFSWLLWWVTLDSHSFVSKTFLSTLYASFHCIFRDNYYCFFLSPSVTKQQQQQLYNLMIEQYAKLYRNRAKSENPPHIFAVADTAYREMLFVNQSQCVVISGESGSGKTESANLLVSYCHEYKTSHWMAIKIEVTTIDKLISLVFTHSSETNAAETIGQRREDSE